jgi:DNA polymerase III subunit epsilon
VYLAMTRGQESLVIDLSPSAQRASSGELLQWPPRQLRVLEATNEELALHETILQDLDKASKGATVWRL